MLLSWLYAVGRSHGEVWETPLTARLHQHEAYDSGPWTAVKAVEEQGVLTTSYLLSGCTFCKGC